MNLVELALATNIPKGCAETALRGDRWGPLQGGDRSWAVGGLVMGWWVGGAKCRMVGGVTGQNPGLTHLSALVLVHVSYLDGKGNLAPQGSGNG